MLSGIPSLVSHGFEKRKLRYVFPTSFAALAALPLIAAEPVRQKIDLLDVVKRGGMEYHMNPKVDYELWPLGQFDEPRNPQTQKTAPANKAVAYRTMMPDSGPSSLAVGLPGGIGFCYDPGRGSINYIWRGEFVDLEPTWKSKINQPASIRGDILYRETARYPLRLNSADREPVYRFKGYRLLEDAIEISYTLDGAPVREEIRATADGSGLLRHFRLSEACEHWWFISEAQAASKLASPEGTWDSERQAFTGKESREFTMQVHFNKA